MGSNDFTASAAIMLAASPKGRPLAGGLAAGLAAALAVSLAVIAMQRQDPLHKDEATAVSADPWVEIANPPRRFGLSAAAYDGRLAGYTARLNRQSGARIDGLTFGNLTGDRPFLRLALASQVADPGPERSFFLTMVRAAAEIGLAVTRSSLAAPLVTRFGTAEAGDVTLSGPAGESRCAGVRLTSMAAGLTLVGFSCGADTQPIDRAALACVIDQLDLSANETDQRLQRAFAEPPRPACQAPPPRPPGRAPVRGNAAALHAVTGKKGTPGKS
jgi:hypothetical protein